MERADEGKFDGAGKPTETLEGRFSSTGQFIEGRYTGPKSGDKMVEGTFAGADIFLAKIDTKVKEGELLIAKNIAFDYGKDWVSSEAMVKGK